MVAFPPRLNLAQLPTPIHKLGRLTKELGDGPTIWIKRDDDTGSVLSGNKVRKLAFVVSEALNLGADTLITCGGLQSNHCRATAAVAKRMGLDVTLFLRGRAPERPDGNYFLNKILGANILHITADDYKRRDEIMASHANELRSRGKNPFVIAEGASMAMGVWGYIHACEEIAIAQKELGLKLDHIVCATGSGGTSAGLELGCRLFRLKAKPWAVNVCDDEQYFRKQISGLISKTIERFDLEVSVEPNDIGIIDGYVGRGYAMSTPQELEFIRKVASQEGIILDPAYTGKALYGLVNELESGRFDNKENILFIHTGGIFGLFPKIDEVSFD